MKLLRYLVITRRGSTRIRQEKPEGLRSGEVAVRLMITVNDKVFQPLIPTVEMRLFDEHLIEPEINVQPLTADSSEPADAGETGDESPRPPTADTDGPDARENL